MARSLHEAVLPALWKAIPSDGFTFACPELISLLWAADELSDTSEVRKQLEFEGDTFLQTCVTVLLRKRLPEALTASYSTIRCGLVANITLALVMRNVLAHASPRIAQYVIKRVPAILHMSEPYILHKCKSSADIFETIVGAYYREQGLAALEAWLQDIFTPLIRIASTALGEWLRPIRQEWHQVQRKRLRFEEGDGDEEGRVEPASKRQKVSHAVTGGVLPVRDADEISQQVNMTNAATFQNRTLSPSSPSTLVSAPRGTEVSHSESGSHSKSDSGSESQCESDSQSDAAVVHGRIDGKVSTTSAKAAKKAVPVVVQVKAIDPSEDSGSSSDESVVEVPRPTTKAPQSAVKKATAAQVPTTVSQSTSIKSSVKPSKVATRKVPANAADPESSSDDDSDSDSPVVVVPSKSKSIGALVVKKQTLVKSSPSSGIDVKRNSPPTANSKRDPSVSNKIVPKMTYPVVAPTAIAPLKKMAPKIARRAVAPSAPPLAKKADTAARPVVGSKTAATKKKAFNVAPARVESDSSDSGSTDSDESSSNAGTAARKPGKKVKTAHVTVDTNDSESESESGGSEDEMPVAGRKTAVAGRKTAVAGRKTSMAVPAATSEEESDGGASDDSDKDGD